MLFFNIAITALLSVSVLANNRMTYYGCPDHCSSQEDPSCGSGSIDSDYFAALSTDLPHYKDYCGDYVVVMETKEKANKLVRAKVVDSCSTCEKYHIDLSKPAFTKLTEAKVGESEIIWSIFDIDGKLLTGPHYNSVSKVANSYGLSSTAFVDTFKLISQKMAASHSISESFSITRISSDKNTTKKTTTITKTSTTKSSTSITSSSTTTTSSSTSSSSSTSKTTTSEVVPTQSSTSDTSNDKNVDSSSTSSDRSSNDNNTSSDSSNDRKADANNSSSSTSDGNSNDNNTSSDPSNDGNSDTNNSSNNTSDGNSNDNNTSSNTSEGNSNNDNDSDDENSDDYNENGSFATIDNTDISDGNGNSSTQSTNAGENQEPAIVNEKEGVSDEKGSGSSVGITAAALGTCLGASGIGLLFLKKKNPSKFEALTHRASSVKKNISRTVSRRMTGHLSDLPSDNGYLPANNNIPSTEEEHSLIRQAPPPAKIQTPPYQG